MRHCLPVVQPLLFALSARRSRAWSPLSGTATPACARTSNHSRQPTLVLVFGLSGTGTPACARTGNHSRQTTLVLVPRVPVAKVPPMLKFISLRLLFALPALWLILTMVFLLAHIVP